MTNEQPSLVDSTVSKSGMEFPIAKVKGGAADAAYGVSGFPTYVLVGPDGKVAFVGHDSGYARQISKLIEEAVLVPKLEGRNYTAINKAIRAQKLGAAWKKITAQLERAPDDDVLLEAREAIEQSLYGRLRAAENKRESGAFAEALTSFEAIVELYDGMPQATQAMRQAQAIRKDPAAKDDLAAWSLLEKAMAQRAKGKKAARDRADKLLRSIIETYGDTPTAKRARRMLSI